MDNPEVLAVFVGAAQPFPDGSGRRSGIVKARVAGPAEIRRAGLAGDENAERPCRDEDQAVCAYPASHYDWWRGQFGASSPGFGPGAFGENLVLAGVSEAEVCIGDVYRVGTAQLQVSKPRGPCRKIGQRHGIPHLASVMRRSLRTGWYLRVVRPGVVQAGAPLELLDRPSPEVTVGRVARAMYHDRADLDLAREMLACPALAGNWRDVLAARVGGRPEPPL